MVKKELRDLNKIIIKIKKHIYIILRSKKTWKKERRSHCGA